MQNINIHGARPKRSVQSLIQDSAIDHQEQVINFQIVQLKKAYNQTYKSFNQKVIQLQSEIAKYKERCKKLQQANVTLAQKCQKFQEKHKQYTQIKLYSQKMKRKLQYVEGKYQKLMENRSLVAENYNQQINYQKWALGTNSASSKNLKIDKNEVYKQISDLINKKIKQFTYQLKQYHMTKQIELKIQGFLQELIYITPITIGDALKSLSFRDKEIGKISRKQTGDILLSQQQAWKDLQVSIQKLKNQGTPQRNNSQKRTTPQKRQNLFNKSYSKKLYDRSRSPLTDTYNQNQDQDYIKVNPLHSRSKPKIFTNP